MQDIVRQCQGGSLGQVVLDKMAEVEEEVTEVTLEENEENADEFESNDRQGARKRKNDNRSKRSGSKAGRKWKDEETSKLIDLLERHTCLWDIFQKDYHIREKRDLAFKDMESKLKICVADIKSKIVCLRTQLGRELAKTKKRKTGQGVDEVYTPSWLYWNSLQFLCPVMNAGKSKDNLAISDRESPSPDPHLMQISDDDISERRISSENMSDNLSTSSSTSTRVSSSKVSFNAKKQDLISTCIRVLKQPVSLPDEEKKHCHFSMYVAEKLSTFDRRTRLIAEKRINDVLFELEINREPVMESQSIPFQMPYGHNSSEYAESQRQHSTCRGGSGQFMSLLNESVQYTGK